MSMLAERKIKQKWSLNPRGKAWAQDSNKFGQKMLEKMGWQHGKGLGPNGKGITEHIKVSYKNDSRGMGYKETDNQWTEHENNFTSLLDSLSGSVEKSDELKITSLEKKSQTSRARVHYHKFTRGKDLSRYSEKDLANIFGKKTLTETKKETKEESDDNEEKIKSESAFLLNAGSMRDYFKKKLSNFSSKTNGYEVGHNGVLRRRESESESEMTPSFGFGFKQGGDTEQSNNGDFTIKSEVISDEKLSVSYVNTNEVLVGHTKKNKNKRKAEECTEQSALSPKKKSKRCTSEEMPKKKSKTKLGEDVGLSNPAFNPLCTPVKVQRHILNTIQESISENSEAVDNSLGIIEVEAEVYDNTLEKKNEVGERNEETPKKKRKKKSQKIDEIVIEVCSSEEKKKSKKKNNIVNGFLNNVVVDDLEDTPKKRPKIGTENPIFNTSVESECSTRSGENPYEVNSKEKKKKKKETKMAIDNPNFEDTEESIGSLKMEANPYEVKVKEKKKKKKEKLFAIDNPNLNVTLQSSINSSLNSSEFDVNPYEVRVKEKKKKSKKEKMAQENPNFNGTENSTDSSQIEENPYEVKIKKKSKKTKLKMESSVDSVEVEENTYEVTDKKKKNKNKEVFAVDNPYFDPNDSVQVETENNAFEVERKKTKIKKSKEDRGIVNPGLNLDTSESENKENNSIEIEESDIMLNVVTTPIIAKPKTLYKENTLSITKVNSVKRTKSVRFSDVTQERIIPNNEDLRNMSETEIEGETFSTQVNGYLENESNSTNFLPLNEGNQSKRGKKRKLGLDNAAFDKQKNTMEENLDSISKTIDMYQAEIENDINEKKLETFQMDDIMVGEVGNPQGENEKVTDGIKLKFKYAHFQSKLPFYQLDKTGAKKSYKHLIKGDIVVKFKDSNLHEIKGYAVKKKK